jgi:2-aminoethylphosphonate-pyruvate transaminase
MDQRIRLMNPGPVTLSRRVRQALLGPDLCHREPEFSELQRQVRDGLERVYPEAAAHYAAVLMAGSGTAAVEAMVGSLVPRAGKALVVANGAYGERVAAILQVQGREHDVVRSPWTEPMDLDAVARRLGQDRRLTHVVAVHHETTTGRLNDVAALGALCRGRGVALLLDAVSSFAAEELDFEGWNLEACASTSNKCLHGAPGVCFVLARREALEGRPSAACSVYLDLARYHQEQGRGYPPFTPSVQATYALREALAELAEGGGWRRRRQHYRELSGLLRDGLARQGALPLLADPGACSASLTSFRLPEGVDFARLYEGLKRERFVIYPGQQALAGAIFRLAVMGDLSRSDMEEFLSAFPAARAHARGPALAGRGS